MQESELEICVKRAQRGDREAVDSLLLSHKQAVFALALTFLKDRELAQEAAQEAFIRIFCRLSTLKKPRRFRSWCLTITANYCRDLLKTKRPKTLPLDQTPELVAEEPENELSEKLREAVQNLKPKLRQALILRDVENFSYSEISDIQKTALGTVKSRIFEARKKIREWIKPCPVKT